MGLSSALATSNAPIAVLASPECTYRIVMAAPTKPTLTQTATPTSPTSLSKTPFCFEPTVRNAMHLCNGVFGTDARPGGFVKSVLLSAPAGGGKSVLLDTVASMCAETHEGVTVVRASCKGLDQRQDSLTNTTDVIDAIDTSEWGLLLKVLRTLGMEHVVPKQQSTHTGAILLCLDDMDAVFMHYSARKDDNLETGRSAEIYQQFGYQLSQLLHTLASPNNTTRILMIGCTRKDPTQLLRAHTGCPEFEKCFALCSPNFTERVLILNKLLADTTLVYQANPEVPLDPTLLITTAAVQRAARHDWAARLAALSAGYLPGDLAAVIQRVVFLHRGKTAAAQSKAVKLDSAEKKETSEKIDGVLWSTALDAVVSVIPLTLQQLGVQGNSARQSSTGSSSVRLGWSDFAGYTHLVADLKRRLAPLANSTTAISGNVTVDRSPHIDTNPSSDVVGEGVKGKVLRLKGAVLRGIVLHGPSGCGKTLLASVITSEVRISPFSSFGVFSLFSNQFTEFTALLT